jgi:hypothetical protein
MRELLRARRMPASGVKSELMDRLLQQLLREREIWAFAYSLQCAAPSSSLCYRSFQTSGSSL